MILPILSLCFLSFAVSWLATGAMKEVSPRLGFVDRPGGRKIHANPKPLGGGVAIFLGFALPVLIGLAIIQFGQASAFALAWSTSEQKSLLQAYLSGVRDRTPVALELV